MSDLSMSSHKNLPNQMIWVINPHIASSFKLLIYIAYIYINQLSIFLLLLHIRNFRINIWHKFDTWENRTEKYVNGEIATTEFCWIDLKPCTHSKDKGWLIYHLFCTKDVKVDDQMFLDSVQCVSCIAS